MLILISPTFTMAWNIKVKAHTLFAQFFLAVKTGTDLDRGCLMGL